LSLTALKLPVKDVPGRGREENRFGLIDGIKEL